MNRLTVQVPVNVPRGDEIVILSWLRSKTSPHTKRAYQKNIEVFFSQVQKPLREITLTDLQDFSDWYKQKHPEVSTQRRMLYAVKSLFTFAQKQGYIPFNVGSAEIPPKGKDTLAERILTPAQVQNIIYEAQKSGNQRNYVLVLLLFASGIRCEEVCNLQWKDARETENGGQITVFGKERETRAVLLHPKAWQALLSICPENTNSDDYIFASRQTSIRQGLPSKRLTESRVWQIVSTIAEKTGVHASPHFFRHAHATQAMKKTPQRVIQQTLGWKSPLTMMRYQHVMPDESSSLALDL